ncbi:hypothetical protein BD410DRAFT_836840 [Rickenella mellea]|uniref:Uncharacterized protein n=1 Tax=Rickenella mellea TaxID=50990 RepID=A0A4Y7QGF4_9AGAM|nr:hypothetical protein BD410DRAFT_836840 [Rickenella mellea]
MEHSAISQQQLPPPRLRLTRQNMSSASGISTRPTDLTVEDGHEQDEDDASTPRRPLLDLARDQPESAEATPVADTPAARLRALLSRVPNSATPKPSAPPPPSELESDFDTPHGSSSGNKTPHVSARESLKELFSRAMREGGDSPVKGRNLLRRRRNSIGSSGVEESPRKSRVKRMSMSDEEAERMTNNTSQNSVRSSSAATFDSLRARLSNVNTIFGSSQHEYNSIDKETQLNDISLPSGTASPPAATSTPLRQSISQFPSQFSGSNLLNEDSDMQRNVRDVEIESSVDIPPSRPRTMSTPHQASTSKAGPSSVRHMGRTDSQSRTNLVRHGSADTTDEMSSRASSSQSAADYKERVKDRDQDPNREREKAWNRPTSILSRHHSGTRSPVANRNGSGLTRRGSSASLLSSDGDGNGHMSNAIAAIQHRKGKEREHEIVNHEHPNGRPNLSRAQSAQTPKHPPHGERTRTLSQPTRPGSSPSQPLVSGSPAVRERKLSHRRSSSSLSVGHNGVARASSPASSLASHESLDEFEREKQHERERNWNSARPKWELTSDDGHEHHHHLTRGASPLPDGHNHHHHHSRNESPNEKRNGHVNGPHKHSITEGKLAEWSASVANASNSIISHLHSSRETRPRSPHHSTTSTTPPTNPNKSSGSASRFGWSFPRSKSPLPPLEEDHNPSRVNGHQRMPSSPSPAPRPEHTSAAAGSPSHIPVRRRNLSETAPGSPGGEHRKGHKRSTTELSESVGGIPPSPSKPFYESTANYAEPQHEASTSAGAQPGPSGNGIQNPPPPQENNPFDDSFSSSIPRSFSPPPSPPASRPSSSVSTPKRNSTMASMKMEFQTPSPPKGLPPLPGTPSSAGDEESDRTPVSTPKMGTQTNGIENMKTPRPPGAWSTPFTTPMPERASSLPLQKNPSNVYLGMRPDTPPASLSRATSMTMQTPAPPGAWASPSGRRKALKVRFDDDPSAQDLPQNTGGDPSNEQFTSVDAVPTGTNQADRGTHERSPSPPRPAPRTPRRSPGIRVLDAFGNELSAAQEEPESFSESKDEEKSSPERLVVESPSRRKSKIRVLDAMGREIPDEGLLSQTEDSRITSDATDGESHELDKTQAKDLLQRTIADLRNDLVAIDRVPEVVNVDNSRLTTLYEASRQARAERTKIDQQMQLSNEELVREAGFRSKSLAVRRPVWANRMFFLFTITVQVVLILIIVSQLRAHHMFLTTYYDPFYPELHHHVTRPELVRVAMDNPATSSTVPLGWGLRSLMFSLWERTLSALAPLSHGLFSDKASHEPLFYPT